jgi:Na+/proline symporter
MQFSHYITAAVALIPLATYWVVGSLRRSRASTPADYFIYGQEVSAEDYATVSVGYALQMASIFLFADWGARYGWGALWTPFFWFVGFLLLYILLPRFLDYHGSGVTTLHQYLRKRHNAGRPLQLFAATATVLGLWGAMMAEIDFTDQIFYPLVTSTGGRNLVLLFFLIGGSVFIVINGYKAEVNTERWQVPVAYAFMLVAIIALIPAVWVYSGGFATAAVILLLVMVLAGLYAGFLIMRGMRSAFNPSIIIAVLGTIALCVAIVVARRLPAGHAPTILSQPLSNQLWAQGTLGLISLFVANALWMPVDLSTWQRIASVRGTGAPLLNSLKKGTLRVLFESPVSWVMGVALGVSIQASGILRGADPAEGVGRLVGGLLDGTFGSYPHWVSIVVYELFVGSCIAIMLSTVNSFLSAISFTFYKDVLPQRADDDLASARRATVVLVVVGAALYIALRTALGANLATFLYSAYAAQLSLFIVALLALYKRNVDRRAATWSVGIGLLLSAVTFAVAMHTSNPAVAVIPPVVAMLGSAFSYLLFYRGSPQTPSTS